MLLKVDCVHNAVGKQPSIPLIDLWRKWMLNWWWWWWLIQRQVDPGCTSASWTSKDASSTAFNTNSSLWFYCAIYSRFGDGFRLLSIWRLLTGHLFTRLFGIWFNITSIWIKIEFQEVSEISWQPTDGQNKYIGMERFNYRWRSFQIGKFLRLFPAVSTSLVDSRKVSKSIQSSKTCFNTHGENCLMVFGPLVVELILVRCHWRLVVYPTLAWKKPDVFKINDDDRVKCSPKMKSLYFFEHWPFRLSNI